MSVALPRGSVASVAPVVAVIGNPNTGKTTLFNALTGLRQKIGNYPGCTVERKTGRARIGGGTTVDLVDLPGTYSLAARSPDEIIAVDVLLGQQSGERPIDLILAIVHASHLERNLYLISQLLEIGLPLVVALNMNDVAEGRGVRVDAERLAERLGVPVVPIRADRGHGLDELGRAIERVLADPPSFPRPERSGPRLPPRLRTASEDLHRRLSAESQRLGRKIPPIEAFRTLIDRGGAAEQRVSERIGPSFVDELESTRRDLGGGTSLAAIETAARYAWVHEIVDGCLVRPRRPTATATDRIDSVLTHGIWGTAALAIVLAFVFQAIYRWSAPLMGAIQAGFDGAGSAIAALVPEGPLQSLLVDGVIGGAGSVIVFLPQIMVLFFFLALLEDCGYMARAAFLLDKLFARFGLSGKSMIPLLSSFACAVPGIMAARTIESRRQRLATMVIAPLMSCSARLPVYVLLIGAFVPDRRFLGGLAGLQGLTLLGAHVVGIAVAIPVLWVLRRTLLRGPAPTFMMELPDYRLPSWRTVVARVVNQARAFLVRAGTIIFAASIVVWALSYFPHPGEIHDRYEALRATAPDAETVATLDREEAGEYLRQSVMGRLGRAVEPAVRPLGWDWRVGMAVVASFPAREVVIATMGTIFNLGADVDERSSDLTTVLKGATWPDGRPLFGVPVALSLIVFFALCCQCASTLAVMKRESGSWGWVALTFFYMTALAYAAALVVYQAAAWILG